MLSFSTPKRRYLDICVIGFKLPLRLLPCNLKKLLPEKLDEWRTDANFGSETLNLMQWHEATHLSGSSPNSDISMVP
jgi:hypothetical protein